MKTTPTKWDEDRERLDASRGAIVKLYDGTTTWYFGTRNMDISEGHVYGLLLSWSDITDGCDIYSKRFKFSDMTLRLSNAPYKKADGADSWTRPSDELGNIRYAAQSAVVVLYLYVGDRVAQISDCMLAFSGIAIETPIFDDTRLDIRAVNKGRLMNVALTDQIVIGEFKKYWDATADTGLVKCKPTNPTRGLFSEQRIADHAIDSSTGEYASHDIPEVVELSAAATTLTGSAHIDLNHNMNGDARLFPTSERVDGVSVEGTVDNWYNILDQNPTTYASVKDENDTGTDANDYRLIRAAFGFPNFPDSGFWIGIGSPRMAYIISKVAGRDGSWTSADWGTNPNYTIRYEANGASSLSAGDVEYLDGTESTNDINIWVDPPDIWRDVLWHWRAHRDDDEPVYIRLSGTTEINENLSAEKDADGIADNELMLKVYYLYIKIRVGLDNFNAIWSGCKGLEYGSWITSRSSNYADGDAIEDPAGIVEALLRSYANGDFFVVGDIDLTTFIDAENTSVAARLATYPDYIGKSLFEIIRQISEQSTFAFLWTSAGKARLVPLNDSSPTTDRTIPWSHIKDKSIRVSKTQQLRNVINYDSRWMAEYGKYWDEGSSENDTVSEQYYGTFEYNAKWPNICGSSATHVAQHYVALTVANPTKGIWSREHIVVEFETVGFLNADLEPGDWIELDDATVDPHIKAYGTSWSGKQLLITKIRQGKDSTKITALELW